MKILLTGSSGFIGSRLVKSLRESHEVFGVDIKRAETTSYQIDLTLDNSRKYLSNMIKEKEISFVIHLAALIDVAEGELYPLRYWNTNVKGTYNVISAMKDSGISKIIFFSSAAVYKGINSTDQYLTENSPLDPISVYGRSKLEAESLLLESSLDFVILRLPNVAGGKELYIRHLIPLVFEKLSRNESPLIFGNTHPTFDGTCIRDYLHVDDVVQLIHIFLKGWNSKKHQIYNTGASMSYSVKQVMDKMREFWRRKTGVVISPTIVKARKGDPPILTLSSNRLFNDLGWSNNKTLEDIISQTYFEMFLENNVKEDEPPLQWTTWRLKKTKTELTT